MSRSAPVTTILCAGPGLGFYVPGILMQRKLQEGGIPAVTEVFEGYLQTDRRNNVAKAKQSFHRNFSFALMGQNLAKDPSPFLDRKAVSELIDTWRQQRRRHFLVFSGFWIPVLERYRLVCQEEELRISLCHVDAANSTSWSLFDTSASYFQHHWFNDWENRAINFHINIDDAAVLPFSQRADRYIIHGGGWGMGTYRQKIAELNAAGLALDIIAYEKADLETVHTGNDYYILDPEWRTWDRNRDGTHSFPPLAAMERGKAESFQTGQAYPPIYDLVKRNKAIISKPGAGTLMDSLSSETPLVYLEPFGSYEAKNAALWQHSGLGLPYDEWKSNGFDPALLEPMAERLAEIRQSSQNFVTVYKKWVTDGTKNLGKF